MKVRRRCKGYSRRHPIESGLIIMFCAKVETICVCSLIDYPHDGAAVVVRVTQRTNNLQNSQRQIPIVQ